MALEELIDNCRENGEHLFADFLLWMEALIDANPGNVDGLLVEFQAWAGNINLPVPRDFVETIHNAAWAFAENDSHYTDSHTTLVGAATAGIGGACEIETHK